MQGRLLHKYQGRYQAHPKDYWRDEFKTAKEIGLDCIEFILDFNDSQLNPLLAKNGLEEILYLSEKTGVDVITICADYFMEAPLHSEDLNVSLQSQKVLIRLLDNAQKLGVTDIVLPCVDQSSLDGQVVIDRFVKNFYPAVEVAEKSKINLSLETDLAPQPFGELLDRLKSNRVSVNYDIGNSASLGFDAKKEFITYGKRIKNVHVKDRVYKGNSVKLGYGNANFEKIFFLFSKIKYKGNYILQTARAKNNRDHVAEIEENLTKINKWIQ